jgi:hypothetical protein
MARTSGSAGDKSLSTLASVFQYKDLVATWSKFSTHPRYAKLHEEFWGKSMTIEEQEWRDSQEAMDLAMEVADDDDSNPESETGPGCYPLDFRIHSRGPRLWIRKDFIRMYDFCDQWYEQVTSMGSRANRQAPSVVITGQSGVG